MTPCNLSDSYGDLASHCTDFSIRSRESKESRPPRSHPLRTKRQIGFKTLTPYIGLGFFIIFCAPSFGQTGDIQVSCAPGLRVYLDGIFVGTSSLNEDGKYLSNLSPGNHIIRVEKLGLIPFEKSVSVVAGRAVDIKVETLIQEIEVRPGGKSQKEAIEMAVGSLLVRCAPLRCTYEFLDRSYRIGPGETYHTISGVPAGEHAISFHRGEVAIEGKVSVLAGELHEIKADFISGELIDVTAEDRARQRARFLENPNRV